MWHTEFLESHVLCIPVVWGAVCFVRRAICLFCFLCFSVVLAITTARQTTNSLTATLSSTIVSSAPVPSVATSRTSSFFPSSQPGKPVVFSSPIVSTAATANPYWWPQPLFFCPISWPPLIRLFRWLFKLHKGNQNLQLRVPPLAWHKFVIHFVGRLGSIVSHHVDG